MIAYSYEKAAYNVEDTTQSQTNVAHSDEKAPTSD